MKAQTKHNTKIRRATKDDAEAIAHVHVNSWQTTYKGLLSQQFLDNLSVENRTAMWKRILEEIEGAEKQMLTVAESESDRIIGFVDGGELRGHVDGFDCELRAIYIVKSEQHRGIGSALTLELCRWLYARNFKKLLVWVLEGNPSKKFYESIGGERLAETKSIEIGGQKCIEFSYGFDVHKLTVRLRDRLELQPLVIGKTS